MRIVFSMAHLGSFRMYEPVLRELARRGHTLHLSIGRSDTLGWSKALDALVAEFPGITSSLLSPPGSAFWAEVAKTIRIWADYLRYLHPDYDAAPKLKARAAERVPRRLVALSDRPLFAQPGNRRLLLAALRFVERALPRVAEIERELRDRQPDLVLVTPLVFLGSSQFEVLREALRQGIRTALAVGSWDHLSSKALIRDMPHRVFVWNETQKGEAVRLHAVPPERVVVTGAQCYDQWFGRQPVRSREAFCARVGLPGDRPFFLYVCSALFWGSPVEAAFVRRWVRSIRESADPGVRSAAILVRPHPARMDEWGSVDLSVFEHVALYGSNPVDASSKDDYFESLFYSSAVVGLNTSAFIEGAVVGRPVHTVLLPEFHENQEGVLHFHYLLSVGGGVLQAARSFDEHHAKLAASLAQDGASDGAGFLRAFVRPHGMDVPATPMFCDGVEELLRTPAPAPARIAAGYTMVRWLLYPILLLLRSLFGADVIRDDWSRKEEARVRAREDASRARDARRRQALEVKQARARRRSEEGAERARAIARKAEAKVDKQRERDTRHRKQRRSQWRARIKARAVRLLPFRSGGNRQPDGASRH